jgi:hypothetical protein
MNTNIIETSNMTLPQLVDELTDRKNSKHDYVVPSNIIRMTDEVKLLIPDTNAGEYVPNEILHQHFAARLGIPGNYYRRMQVEFPDLLATNVNRLLRNEGNKHVLVRTFEHDV